MDKNKDAAAAAEIARRMTPWRLAKDSVNTSPTDIRLGRLRLPESEKATIFLDEIFEQKLSEYIGEGAAKSDVVAVIACAFVKEWGMPDEEVVMGSELASCFSAGKTALQAI